MSRAAWTSLAAAIALLVGSAFGASAQQDETLRLPGGPEKALIVANCQLCHSVGLIAQQRLSEKTWTSELVKMEKWGSALPPDQNAFVAAYLVKYFGPDVPAAPGKLVHSPK